MTSKIKEKVVPYIFGLRKTDIIDFGKEHFDIESYFTESKEGLIVSPWYICNLGMQNKQSYIFSKQYYSK